MSYAQLIWKQCNLATKEVSRDSTDHSLGVDPKRAVGKLIAFPPPDRPRAITKIRHACLALQRAGH